MKKTNNFQLGIIIFMMGIVLLFSILYPMTLAKIGYNYKGSILVPTEENGNKIYTGIVDGNRVKFVVSNEKVEFYCKDKSYGPYTLKEDSMAIPNNHSFSTSMKGIEIKEKDIVIFRGGVLPMGDDFWLYRQDGEPYYMIHGVMSDGTEIDEYGNPIDKMKPSLVTIIELVNGPELTHKGYGFAWFVGVIICILNMVSILYADEIFRFNLSFTISNAEHVEASDWEIIGRYFRWILFTILALFIFVIGLK